MGPIPPSRKKLLIAETGNSNKQCYMGSSTTTCLTPNDDFITWEDGLMTGAGVSRKEACSLRESLAAPKSIMKIGTWNVRTMYRIGKTAVVAREMRKYDIDVLGISECRWAGFG